MIRQRVRLAVMAGLSLVSGCLLDFDPKLLEHPPPPATQSCADGDPLCAGVSCCESKPVPGGTFSRGYDASGSGIQPGDSDPVVGWQSSDAAPATISAFALDTFEVTVRRSRRFVAAYDAWRANGHPTDGEGANPHVAGSGWKAAYGDALPADAGALEISLQCGPGFTYSADEGTRDELPLDCVSWYVAFAFCIWDGGRLPTEAEWNFAAAGGEEQRAFPWSSPPESLVLDIDHAVFGDLPVDVVGSRGALDLGRFGQHDLAGNVREWTLDSAGDLDIYPEASGCQDCASLVNGDRVRRGGDFGASAARSRTAYRSAEPPDDTSEYVGTRCAR